MNIINKTNTKRPYKCQLAPFITHLSVFTPSPHFFIASSCHLVSAVGNDICTNLERFKGLWGRAWVCYCLSFKSLCRPVPVTLGMLTMSCSSPRRGGCTCWSSQEITFRWTRSPWIWSLTLTSQNKQTSPRDKFIMSAMVEIIINTQSYNKPLICNFS